MSKDHNAKLNVILEDVIHKSNAQKKLLVKMLSQLKKDSLQIKAESNPTTDLNEEVKNNK
jgi:hypothetical protein